MFRESGQSLIFGRFKSRAQTLCAAFLVCAVAVCGTHAQQAPPSSRQAETAERRAQSGNLVGHGGPVKAVATDSLTQRVVTGGFDYALMAWPRDGDGKPIPPQRFADHDGAVNAVLPFGNSALAGSDDGRLALWDLRSGQLVHRFTGHTAKIVGLALSPDAKWAATASWDRTARLWNVVAKEVGPVLGDHRGPVNGVAFSADGQSVFTASGDGHVRKFRAGDGELERPIYKHGWGLNVIARVPGTDHLVVGGLNGSVLVIDGQSGDLIRELPAHDRPVLAVAVLEKPGLIASGGGDGVIRVMRASDGTVLETYKHPFGPIWALAFTPDGTGLYFGGLDDFVTLWKFAPRAPFEAVDTSQFPRRFQVSPKAAADATPEEKQLAEGERQFARKCSVCHTLTPDDGNRAGPTLHRIFGRKIATLEGYSFSAPLKTLDIVWTEDTVSKLFELGPDVFTPGSKMPLQQMTDKTERDALIAYLKATTSAK
jgi:cytochrome c